MIGDVLYAVRILLALLQRKVNVELWILLDVDSLCCSLSQCFFSALGEVSKVDLVGAVIWLKIVLA